MSKGKIESFGSPYDLLRDKKNIFYELIHNLEKTEAIRLIQLAKKSSLKVTKHLNEKLAQPIESSQNESVSKIDDNEEENENVIDEEEKLLNK